MIPGSNILKQAFRVVGTTAFDYYAFDSRTTNEIGLDVTVYKEPQTLRGSVQAVPRSVYEQNGLDFSKKYVNVFVSGDVIGIDRDVSGDKIQFKGQTFQCVSTTPWALIDGWTEVLCVAVA